MARIIASINRSELAPTVYESNLRRLHLQESSIGISAFTQLIRQSPFLEDLRMTSVSRISGLEVWITIAECCPLLRAIRLEGNSMVVGMPSLDQLIFMFTNLESFGLVGLCDQIDPDLSTLDSSLQRFEAQHHRRHPLKSLRFTGAFFRPIATLLSGLTVRSIESLTVGDTMHRHSYRQLALTHDFISPWKCEDSLTHLDITTILFPSDASVRQLFRRLQNLYCLQALAISYRHHRG
ncbi:hypothetical protein BGX23_010252 [Mortierella sp. AD031]|nr:hypothetical protein BGX23_010252 [Mortierella sp. AD031]KAG0201675.1 hypothetical protein BGX33_010170 [Mortierella sp. NVP41]